MSATMKAAVHLGQDCGDNLRTAKNTDFEQVKALFDISQSSILNHKSEIYGISTIEWNTTPWMRSTLLHDRAIKLSKAKVHVYSDSVLCLVKIMNILLLHRSGKNKLEGSWFLRTIKN